MGVLDAPMAKVAQSLTQTFGRPATLRTFSAPSYDPPTGSDGSPTPTDVACHVVFSEYSERQIASTTIQRGDRRAIVSRLAVGVEPTPDVDRLIEGERVWRIISVRGYTSGEAEAAYELQVRR